MLQMLLDMFETVKNFSSNDRIFILNSYVQSNNQVTDYYLTCRMYYI